MPINVVNIGSSTTVIGGTVTITVGAGGVPAGAHIFVATSDNAIGTGGVSDSAGNSYANTNFTNTGVSCTLWRERTGNALVNGNTIVYTIVGTLAAVNAFYVTGLANAPADVSNTAKGTSSTPSVGSPAPTTRGEFFVGIVAGASLISSFTQDSTNAAWTSPPGSVSIAAPVLGGGNVINSGSGSLTYAPTFGTSDVWAAIISAYLVQPDVLPFYDDAPKAIMAKKVAAGAAIAAIASGLIFVPAPTLYPSYFGSHWIGPSFNKTIQYQSRAYVEAAPFVETVTEGRWHQPWSEPVRFRVLPTAHQQFTAFGRAAPFPETVFEDRWHEPWSEPVRLKSFPAAEQQATTFGRAAPFPESVTEDRWHQSWSEPVRFKQSLAATEQQFLAAIPTNEVITVDKWFRWLEPPVRQKPGLSATNQQSLALIEAAPFAESVTEDRWHQPWSEPVKTRPFWSANQQSTTFGRAAPFPETVSIDRWLEPLSEPVRRLYRLGSADNSFISVVVNADIPTPGISEPAPTFIRQIQYQSATAPTFVPPSAATPSFGWYGELSRPGIPKSSLGCQDFELGFGVSETINEDKWHFPWAIPVRVKSGLLASQQQFLAFVPVVVVTVVPTQAPGYYPDSISRRIFGPHEQQSIAFIGAAPFPETATEDRWHQPWSEPVRLRNFWTANQQATVLGRAAPFPETVTEDRWHEAWSEPVRIKPGLLSGEQQYLAWIPPPSETITADKWFAWLGEPVRQKLGLPAAEQQFLALVKAAPFQESVTEDRWHQPLSVPKVLAKAGLLTPDQQFLALVQAGPFGEVVFEDKWHQPWSVPKVLSKIGLHASEQQALALVKAAPFGEVIFEDKWHQAWSIPVSLAKPGLRTAAQLAETHSQIILTIPGPTGTMAVTESGDVFSGQLIVYNPVTRAYVSIHEDNPRRRGLISVSS